MAWNLQPFVGDRGEPFRLFRHSEGNFYTAVLYSLQQLAQGEGKKAPAPDRGYRELLELAPPGARDSLGTTRR